jgi:hypothetical protein
MTRRRSIRAASGIKSAPHWIDRLNASFIHAYHSCENDRNPAQIGASPHKEVMQQASLALEYGSQDDQQSAAGRARDLWPASNPVYGLFIMGHQGWGRRNWLPIDR